MAIQYSNVRQKHTDWDFVDPTQPRKHYIVSFDEGCWCGTVQTSKTDDGCFDDDDPMDPEMLRELRALIPQADLPPTSELRNRKIMAMVSKQGTACSETALYEHEDTPAMREKIERESCLGLDDDPVPGSWRDCTEALSEYFAQGEAA